MQRKLLNCKFQIELDSFQLDFFVINSLFKINKEDHFVSAKSSHPSKIQGNFTPEQKETAVSNQRSLPAIFSFDFFPLFCVYVLRMQYLSPGTKSGFVVLKAI